MSTKAFSQQLITDRFNQQKLGTKGKSKNASGTSGSGRLITSSIKSNEASETLGADDLIRKEHLDTLRQFDLDWRFGPCTGITRLERWERAERNGHSPPQDIRDLILKHKDDTEYAQNIWSGYPL